MNKTLIAIVGPTAIGKTSLSLKLAQKYHTEIVSADSRQFYKEMTIGTAVPSPEELAVAPHHFIQHRSITESYSVGDFEKDAIERLEQLFIHNDYVILVGGSGLYVDAITKGLDNFPEVSTEVKEKVKNDFNNGGLSLLQQQLKIADPVYFEIVDLNNTHRVMRALEVSLSSDMPYSSFLTKPKKKRSFRTIKIGLFADRPIIYDRINLRVDLMIGEGLIEEAKKLYPQKELNALNTVGYKELFRYFEGTWEKDFSISEIKKNTRRFAKRQLTWFKKDEEITWFDFNYDLGQILEFIYKKGLL